MNSPFVYSCNYILGLFIYMFKYKHTHSQFVYTCEYTGKYCHFVYIHTFNTHTVSLHM